MAATIVMLAAVVVYFELVAVCRIHRTTLRETMTEREAPVRTRIGDVLADAAQEIRALFDLEACWFEPFPFDALLPRIEQGRIVLPSAEPGVAPWSDTGVELPVRLNGLTLGRFVLQPGCPTAGAGLAPTARDRALAIADRVAAPLGAALAGGMPTDADAPGRSRNTN